MTYRTYEQQVEWSRNALSEFEEKVGLLAISLKEWSGLGKHPNPELSKRVDVLREELLESLSH